MRIELEFRAFPFRKEEKIKVYKTAKELIEKHGIEDYVLEISQLSCMGGAEYIVTHTSELDKKYIGYRGFLTYDKIREKLDKMKKQEKEVDCGR
jgi:hypothetical protein